MGLISPRLTQKEHLDFMSLPGIEARVQKN